MTRTPRLTVRAPVAALVGVLAVLGAAAGALTRHGSVLVHQCVADGTAGALGLRLALLRQDAACPSGELAVGGDPRQVFGVVVMIAVPVLAWHLAGLAAGLGVLARVRAGVRTVVSVLGVLVRLPEPVVVPVPAVRCTPVTTVRTWVQSPVLAIPALRGPPVAAC